MTLIHYCTRWMWSQQAKFLKTILENLNVKKNEQVNFWVEQNSDIWKWLIFNVKYIRLLISMMLHNNK